MRLTKTAVPICVLSLMCLAWGQPSKTPKTNSPKTSTAPAYRQRVDSISNELKPQIAALWQIYGKMEDLNGIMQKHAARNGGETTAADKDDWNKLKSSLAATLQGIRSNTKRLRSVSPVPRPLKKIDSEFVDASFELEEGLDSLVAWTNTPSPEMNLQLGREIRKGITSWTSALVKLNRATDSGVTAKVYTEN